MSTRKQRSHRRIVSKEEYLARVATREAKRWGSVAMAFTVGACFVGAMLCSLGLIFAEGLVWKGFCVVGIVAPFYVGSLLLHLAEKTMQEAQVTLDIVPLTRANESDLRALDVLVRASDAPPSQQQTELLRAVRHSPQSPPEQLLRATQESRQDS